MYESVRAALMLMYQFAEVFNCWLLCLSTLVIYGTDLDQVIQEGFEIGNATTQIDGLVKRSYYWVIGRNDASDRRCEQVWREAAEDAYKVFSISDGQLYGDIVQSKLVLLFREGVAIIRFGKYS